MGVCVLSIIFIQWGRGRGVHRSENYAVHPHTQRERGTTYPMGNLSCIHGPLGFGLPFPSPSLRFSAFPLSNAARSYLHIYLLSTRTNRPVGGLYIDTYLSSLPLPFLSGLPTIYAPTSASSSPSQLDQSVAGTVRLSQPTNCSNGGRHRLWDRQRLRRDALAPGYRPAP